MCMHILSDVIKLRTVEVGSYHKVSPMKTIIIQMT